MAATVEPSHSGVTAGRSGIGAKAPMPGQGAIWQGLLLNRPDRRIEGAVELGGGRRELEPLNQLSRRRASRGGTPG
jgi:hypothetical protein